MRIVILDGYTLNPGDLSWEAFHALGDCRIYDRTLPEEIVSRAADCEILLTNKTVISRETIRQLPDLKYIGLLATGYNVVDIKAAAERGIPVTNIPEYGTMSVAQMVFCHLLNLSIHAAEHSQSVHQGKWSECKDYCFWDFPLVELAGLTMGIVGLGRIGSATAVMAKAFGMVVQAYDTRIPPNIPDDVKMTDLETIFRDSDVVSLHCPLTETNAGFVDAKWLKKMKRSAFLINTSRGQLINEKDLAEALNSGQIAGAGLDVLSVEPPPADNPLLTARNCTITPHISWATRSARQRLMVTAVENIQAFENGKPIHVVNGL
ncbi:D-2-hydroxyacid dehydrogenase [Leptolinea tardivitalis]|uniref:Glycerate dehydrogenase n=1 Tax=Leptolinea tardivitalis TaxID=229920 RepID=A0A0P6XE12_9CHLR|nr:D-2-hydroxyacid dehydrogenase [Leptolinea tardivitalis]KPL73405.1 glycerate dehydrogenase [Leptolinea tardivitalis]GAP21559.1 lactate dehydrogenase [Leptolinea tardivitalis]